MSSPASSKPTRKPPSLRTLKRAIARCRSGDPGRLAALFRLLDAAGKQLAKELAASALDQIAVQLPAPRAFDADQYQVDLWRQMKAAIQQLSSLALRSKEPGQVGAYILECLKGTLDYDLELIYGRYRKPSMTPKEEKPA